MTAMTDGKAREIPVSEGITGQRHREAETWLEAD